MNSHFFLLISNLHSIHIFVMVIVFDTLVFFKTNPLIFLFLELMTICFIVIFNLYFYLFHIHYFSFFLKFNLLILFRLVIQLFSIEFILFTNLIFLFILIFCLLYFFKRMIFNDYILKFISVYSLLR